MNIAFELPSVFREIKTGMSREEARQEVVSRAAAKGIDRPAGEIDDVTGLYERASAMLLADGVVYAASCHGEFNDERSTGTLTIGLNPLAYADESVAVEGIREVMAKKRANFAEVSLLELPCGKAVVAIQQTPALRIPGEFTTAGQDIPVDVAQLQAFIPVPQEAVPGAQTLVTITFSTPSIDHWPEYSEIVAAFLRTLRFLPDGHDETDVRPSSPAAVDEAERLRKPTPAAPADRAGMSAFG
ncbi:hypothetical protein [Streptomyces noursei]|uniref:hypothetical protein n=1 Tax=Streptomyces noursei TaxID=1971 RepID=UPI0016772CB2|nr:hypothetical protein [Streptomyces noursei]MCZ1017817.1 hypothetical protein [Streptomyces noursei]GGW84618.1 hypothetical protein GCM10010341_00730 [Streptomyces noursei]